MQSLVYFHTVDVTQEVLPYLPSSPSPVCEREHLHLQLLPAVIQLGETNLIARRKAKPEVCPLQPPLWCQPSSFRSRRAKEGPGWGFCPSSHAAENEHLLRWVQVSMSLSIECLSDGLGSARGR